MNIENIYGEDKWAALGGFSPIITVFRSFHALTPEMEDIINRDTFPVRFAKNKHIASPLKYNRYIFLILEGAVHGYLKMGNKKITTWIAAENELAGTIRNLWENESSDEYIETIDPVFAIAIPHEMTKLLYENFPIANYVGRKMTEIYFQGASERAYICRLPTALKRYQRFLISYPNLINRVPLKYVASFTGMRLETLSRIRKKAPTEK
ncbi:Crp/Fnr family transcriptional regulator [Pedobacter sp. MR2016-19]|uniref:Crp/Fnr family transcriptional regulator n=1 Tax=unclassified Pedobacter TaxID=2628915 RepID=UPI0018738A22|nr:MULTISPECIES: Crp/Fnr family transcriptional regulator [unclassified Pedobacter]MBE5320081.1 Crp/Fnr family transcriptional regulator [Pedobacter sp. MR2016-19]QXU43580.1 Crp/Fnr family transcriptional regulator [Pedobacter sp. D749]